jgi:hypothetical protein
MLLLLVMLLTACHSDDKEEIVDPDEDCYLDIYVYAPDRPIVTRGDVGDIKARPDAESTVHTLQIWVFKNSDGSLVGYLNAGGNDEAYNDVDGAKISDTSILNEKGQQVYRMKVDKAFANAPEAVDVYVVANAESCGLSYNSETARATLNGAMIGSAYFGTSTRVSSVPANGLPMSAVLKNQPISGKFPTLRIGTESHIATLQLTRAVSKLRFVLCRIDDAGSTKKLISIDEIKLDDGQIPTATYLMPGVYNYPVNQVSSFVSDGSDVITYVPTDEIGKLVPEADDDHSNWVVIPKVTNPLVYAYETQSAQDYEDIINAASDEVESRKAENLAKLAALGITGLTESDLPQLKEVGLTYLRESNKQLKGTIKYTYSHAGATQPQATATFSMAAPGDFLRNHSWIIYIYYMDSTIYTLSVTHIGMKTWETDPLDESVEVYNW